jgi:putative methionine-R-sulfoxide reductase with GAF domain
MQLTNIFYNELSDWCLQKQPNVRVKFQVPLLGEGGTCSLFGELDPIKFDLSSALSAKELELLPLLQNITDYVVHTSKVDWFGIYLKRINEQGESMLTKMSYFGKPSRAEFPLTKEFATLSNNSYVGLTGEKRTINNVEKYRQVGGEYYTCDPKVKSELCWPIISNKNNTSANAQTEILGIIDAECFDNDRFDEKTQAIFEAACQFLSENLTQLKSRD